MGPDPGSLSICINEWDLNGAHPTLSLCDSLSVSSQLHTFASIYFTLHLGSTLCPWFPLQFLFISPIPFASNLYVKKTVSINPLE